MANWRDQVLKQFIANNALYLVLDNDQLLLDELILGKLKEDNIQVVNFNESIIFRYEYERDYRTKIEQEEICLLVRAEGTDYNVFPYDLIQSGQRTRLDVSIIFPKFSTPVIRQLDKELFDALYAAQERYQGSSSDNETLDFISKNIYKLPYDVVHSRAELWKLLLTIHYELDSIPMVIRSFVVNKLSHKADLRQLPIQDLVMSANFFYKYLEDEWNNFVKQVDQLSLQQNGVAVEEFKDYSVHSFTNPLIRSILDNLFLEGLVKRVKGYQLDKFPSWMRVGIESDSEKENSEKLEYLYFQLKDAQLSENRYKDWTKVAQAYGQLKALSLSTSLYFQEVKEISNQIDEHFERWMLHQYGSLISLPHLPVPKMVHQIPHYIASQNEEKVALLIMDGMSFVQWVQIREYLAKYGLSFEEKGVFAWVPTLTAVSRQAIFSGLRPSYFANSISTTNKEALLWNTFWEDRGVSRINVSYQRGLGQEFYHRDNISPLKQPNIRVYGAVIDIIDQFLHGAVQGSKSVFSELNIWLGTNYLVKLIQDLQNEGFSIYLTADHGNRESVGIGRINEGVIAETKGERVRMYDSIELRDLATEKFAQTIKWHDIGLPEKFHVLLAKGNAAFVNKGETIISHGSISIEEVIVPFIKVISET
ncbi:BREX-3 system phosphatase PglZ [Bacillus sp. DNRA2]|uniref:BREX-3 system phosphatase PglZ n=1 Tax=Bacillus sp. DNRA2 TaxID=2723053 RepID=UPI00145C64ED|nr:BREX-3 system phosphatase PglZ [Bacillus sp. DNRA2]NMD71286.1 BREX-3 system phosphatase PglZ [Bacillus sp. DNRA2]